MKKLFLHLVVFILIIITCPAAGGDYYAGLIGGLNFAEMDIVTLRIDHPVEYRSVYGFGGIIGYKLNSNLSVQIEPMYLQKGGIANVLEDQNVKMNMKFTSFELPLLLKVSFGQNIQPYILTGTSFGIITSSESELSMGDLNFNVDIENITKDFEIGLIWGAGVSYFIGGASVFLESTYSVGLTNLNNGGNLTYRFGNDTLFDLEMDKNDKFKNKGFKIMAGFIFPLDQ